MHYEDGRRAAREKFGSLYDTVHSVVENPAVVGAGLHIGANALAKGVLGTQKGKRFNKWTFTKGLQHGVNNQRLKAPVEQLVSSAVMPETLLSYEAGNAMGAHLSEQPRRNIRDLKKLRKAIAMSPNAREAPIVSDMLSGLNSLIDNPHPEPSKSVFVGKHDHLLKADPKDPRNYIIPAATTAAAYAVAPHAALHPVINTIRHAVSKSKAAKGHIARRAVIGATMGQPEGGLATASDLIVSPMSLHAQRIAGAFRDDAKNDPRNVTRIADTFARLMGRESLESRTVLPEALRHGMPKATPVNMDAFSRQALSEGLRHKGPNAGFVDPLHSPAHLRLAAKKLRSIQGDG